MVDEYPGPNPAVMIRHGSDSSMVDEYDDMTAEEGNMGFRFLYGRWIQEASGARTIWPVQIPLWSMNTLGLACGLACGSSDSSMVDEYSSFQFAVLCIGRFRFSMVDEYSLTASVVSSIVSSDSSMVDEYFYGNDYQRYCC